MIECNAFTHYKVLAEYVIIFSIQPDTLKIYKLKIIKSVYTSQLSINKYLKFFYHQFKILTPFLSVNHIDNM